MSDNKFSVRILLLGLCTENKLNASKLELDVTNNKYSMLREEYAALQRTLLQLKSYPIDAKGTDTFELKQEN